MANISTKSLSVTMTLKTEQEKRALAELAEEEGRTIAQQLYHMYKQCVVPQYPRLKAANQTAYVADGEITPQLSPLPGTLVSVSPDNLVVPAQPTASVAG